MFTPGLDLYRYSKERQRELLRAAGYTSISRQNRQVVKPTPGITAHILISMGAWLAGLGARLQERAEARPSGKVIYYR